MNSSDVDTLRRAVGASILNAQNAARENGIPKEEVIVEIIAALLSLAAYVTRHNAEMMQHEFMVACSVAASEQWGPDDE